VVAGCGQKDWGPLDSLLADDFTFSSAAGDEHISKSAFKKRCWETQINFIGHFDLERVAAGPEWKALRSRVRVRHCLTFLLDELPAL